MDHEGKADKKDYLEDNINDKLSRMILHVTTDYIHAIYFIKKCVSIISFMTR